MAGQLKNDNPGHDLTTEELRLGGINSGIARAKKKSLREKAKLLMSLSIKDKDELEKAIELGLNEKEVDVEMMNLVHMLNIIKKENFNSVGAFNSLKDLTDENVETQETPSVQINIVDNSNLGKIMYEGDE
jgi:hypothetical protein